MEQVHFEWSFLTRYAFKPDESHFYRGTEWQESIKNALLIKLPMQSKADEYMARPVSNHSHRAIKPVTFPSLIAMLTRKSSLLSLKASFQT